MEIRDSIAFLKLLNDNDDEAFMRIVNVPKRQIGRTRIEFLKNLREKNLTLAVAESCTGGLVSSYLVEIAGCSVVLRESFITYSNEAKTARLNVCPSLLKTHGAVSAQVAVAMAEGAAKTSGATVGLSVTGIAGPDGGTEEKPVGLVYIGLFMENPRKLLTESFNIVGNRNIIRTRSAIFALDFLRRNL
jgi:nicotinamide-nucleotide amidase